MYKPWISALFNALIPGSGYIFIGERKALGIYLVILDSIFTIWYTVRIFTDHALPFNTFISTLISLISLLLAIDAFRLAKKKFTLPYKAVKETYRQFNYVLLAALAIQIYSTVSLAMISSMFMLNAMAFNDMTFQSYSIPNPSLYMLISLSSLPFYIAGTLLLPLIHKKLRVKKPPYFKTIALIMGISVIEFVFLMITMGVMIYKIVEEEEKHTPPLEQQFTKEQLTQAINEKRTLYEVEPLVTDPWACVIAENELADNVAIGDGEFTAIESYEEAIHEAKEAYKAVDEDNKGYFPTFMMEYTTYGLNLEDTMSAWETSSNKLLFLDKEYTLGCTAVKDGYGIVVVGHK